MRQGAPADISREALESRRGIRSWTRRRSTSAASAPSRVIPNATATAGRRSGGPHPVKKRRGRKMGRHPPRMTRSSRLRRQRSTRQKLSARSWSNSIQPRRSSSWPGGPPATPAPTRKPGPLIRQTDPRRSSPPSSTSRRPHRHPSTNKAEGQPNARSPEHIRSRPRRFVIERPLRLSREACGRRR